MFPRSPRVPSRSISDLWELLPALLLFILQSSGGRSSLIAFKVFRWLILSESFSYVHSFDLCWACFGEQWNYKKLYIMYGLRDGTNKHNLTHIAPPTGESRWVCNARHPRFDTCTFTNTCCTLAKHGPCWSLWTDVIWTKEHRGWIPMVFVVRRTLVFIHVKP